MTTRPGPVLGGAVVGARDAGRRLARRNVVNRSARKSGDLESAISWLCRTHDVTGRQGSSKGFSLTAGWLPAYPETTGYLIETFLKCGQYAAVSSLRGRAIELGEWEMRVQRRDGGVIEGTVGDLVDRPVVFNSGMVLHGYLDLHQAGVPGFYDAASLTARWLAAGIRPDGTWPPDVEYHAMPHTYNSRVAWALLRWSRVANDTTAADGARRQLGWVLSRQHANGWFTSCTFKPGQDPSTHAIAYTLRGLLEAYLLTQDDAYIGAVITTSERLMKEFEIRGALLACYDSEWRATTTYTCLTGLAQLARIWLQISRITDDPRFLSAGLKLTDQVAFYQERLAWTAVHGALPGSFPVWGRYAPFQYPNWATKFLADLLLYRAEITSDWP